MFYSISIMGENTIKGAKGVKVEIFYKDNI
jgi:hypothetical protein